MQYISVSAEARGYYPITDNITFVGRAIGGTSRAGAARTFACSTCSSRAARRSAASTVPALVRATCSTGDALGGAIYWATTAEVRFPIPFVPDDLGICGAVFADAGSLWSRRKCEELNTQLRAAVRPMASPVWRTTPPSARRSGASLMWTSPVGPHPHGFRQGPHRRKTSTRSSSSASARRPSSNCRPIGAKKTSVCVSGAPPLLAFRPPTAAWPRSALRRCHKVAAWSIPDSSRGPGRSRWRTWRPRHRAPSSRLVPTADTLIEDVQHRCSDAGPQRPLLLQ